MTRRATARTEPRPRERRTPGTGSAHAVIRSLAMRDVTGQPARCWPSLDEQRGQVPAAAHSNGRVAYADERTAAEAAARIDRLPDTVGVSVVQRCPRTDTELGEHWHLRLAPER